ncbi:MAG: hypothetical protein HDKAJFGB_03640 [Anaerolineae bacterium]|nr:hypothetical protein [Anaerolineae bacterium]
MKRLTLTHFALAQLILLLTAALFLAACSGATPAPNGGAAPAPTAAGGLLGAPVSGSAAAKPPAARNDMFTSAPPMTIDPTKTYRATLETSKGNIVMDLYPQDAPQTVNNFVFLAREGFYDGLTFHRYEPGFVIQGGDPLGNGTGGPGYTIPPEIKRTHPAGAVAMARRGGPPETTPSSGSQFYITLDATPNLDGGYTSFGQVTPESMAVVMQIRKNDVINKITIEEK